MKIESVCCSVFEIWPRKLHHHSWVDPNSRGGLSFGIGLNSRVNALLSWDGIMIGALARRQQLGGRWGCITIVGNKDRKRQHPWLGG